MKNNLFSVISIVVLAALAILIQGCASLGKLPTGMVWYKPGASAEQTEFDWMGCQQQVLQNTPPQATPNQLQTVSSPPPTSSTTVQPNAYGLGVNSDEYGRPSTYQLQNGQQLDPIFNSGVKQNVYGPGVGQDQFGRPVYNAPYGNNMGQGNNGGQGSDVGGQLALNALAYMRQNHMAKKYMTAKGYYLVSTNSPLIKNRQSQGFLIDTAQIAQMDNAQKVAEAGKTQVTVNPTSDGQQSAGGVASQYPDMEPSLKALLQLVSNRQAGLSCVELRTYTPMPGCLNALVSRFRASRAIFERHGITVIGYTVESESQTSGKLIYALASQDASAHRESWRGFAEDPEWKRMKETTEANGSLVSKIKNDFLH